MQYSHFRFTHQSHRHRMIVRWQWSLGMKVFFVATCLALLGPVSDVSAADLLERVKADAGLCVIVDDLPTHLEELASSDLRARLESLELYQKWLGASDVTKLKETLSQLQEILGTPIPNSMLNLVGEQALIAIYPQADQRPAGVLMTRPANYEQAERLLDLWHLMENADVTQMEGGHWKRATHKITVYYILEEGFFALSDREELIRDLSKPSKISQESSLSQQPFWKQGITQASDASWMRVWFRPELWKGVIQLPQVGGPQGVLLDQLKRAESLLLEVDTEAGVHAALHLIYKTGKEPDQLIAYRKKFPPQPGILDSLSPETMSLMTGRGGLGFLGTLIDRRLAHEKNQEQEYFREILSGLLIDKDPYLDVLPAMGAQWMMEIRRGDSQSKHPVEFLMSTSLEPARDETVTLKQSLENLLRSGLKFLAISEKRLAEDVISEDLPGGDRVHRYKSRLGWEPSFVVTNSHLLIASDEERVRQAVLEANGTQSDSPFGALKNRELANSQLGVMVDFQVVREVIGEPSDELFELLNIPVVKQRSARQSLSFAADTLGLFEGGYAFWQCVDGGWNLYFGAILINE